MSSDFTPADSVGDGQDLREFIDAALAAEEASKPPETDAAVEAILQAAYTRDDGWCAVMVTDRYGREFELGARCYEDLQDSVRRFLCA